jgi:predicted RNA-binding protein YlxR (DUF448 family)
LTKTPLRTRPLPQRTCVGCVSTTNKRDLVRVVRTPEGRVEADPTGKRPGRGAYVHADPACWSRALTKGGLSRSLKVSISPDDVAALQAYAGTMENS